MATNLSPRRSPSRSSLLLVSLLTLVGILSGCGASSTVVPSHPSGSTPNSTPTQKLKGTISEIPLPAHVSPGDITTGPDGNLWFTAGGTIGRITPAGTISEFPLPSSSLVPNSGGPNTITKGPDRALWFTTFGTAVQNGKLWRITTAGMISEFPLPDPQSHPIGLSTGSDGNLWCVGFVGNNAPKGTIWRITPTGKISAFPPPSGFYPFAITAGADGNLWFAEADLDGSHDKIARLTPTGTISEFPLPNFLSDLNGITAGPDGNTWFTEDTDNHSQNGKIGRITLTGTISEFPLPTPQGGPGAITGGPDGKIWFIERNSNKIGHLV